MRRRGVIYDTGTVFSGPGYKVPTRPKLGLATADRELQIARDDLHCNAVRLGGSYPDRLVRVAERALALGLEVWLSPALFGRPAEETLMMPGIVPGRDFAERAHEAFNRVKAGEGGASGRLDEFLSRASAAVRAVYRGPLTYASLVWEDVDWDRFDIIGVDHYRDARIKDRYAAMLEPLLARDKPVVITEFGMRTYQGAASGGGELGFGIFDLKSVFLHQLPLVGRFVRERLNGDYVRDEAMQARELTETLAILNAAGVDGTFVAEFVTAGATTSDRPRYDLDLNAFSLVKSYRHEKGATYPDMNWEPKQSFSAVADFYSRYPDQGQTGRTGK